MKNLLNSLNLAAFAKCVFVGFVAVFMSACSDSNITKIKNGFLDIDKSLSIGYVLENYEDCSSLTWTSFVEDGRTFVVAKCDVDKITKSEFEKVYKYANEHNYLVTVNFLKPFMENFDMFKNLHQKFFFLINQDGSFELSNITANTTINGKEISLNADNVRSFISAIYQNKTITDKNSDSSYYIAHVQNFVKTQPELIAKFGLDFKNTSLENEFIIDTPFGFTIGKTTLMEAFKQIPCFFAESKFADGIFEKNGYYLIYDNCKLNKGMTSLELGFDDEQKLVDIFMRTNNAYRYAVSNIGNYYESFYAAEQIKQITPHERKKVQNNNIVNIKAISNSVVLKDDYDSVEFMDKNLFSKIYKIYE